MRAVVLSFWVVLACGGRTLDDGTYDEESGASGSGGAGAAPSAGAAPGTGAGPSRPPSGGPGKGSGGSPSMGGSPSAGGSFGGAPSGMAGKTGGFAGGFAGGSTGGVAGSGGSIGVDGTAECSKFCGAYNLACPGPEGFDLCEYSCLENMKLTSRRCFQARVNSLFCMAEVYAASPMMCGAAEQRVGPTCSGELMRAELCEFQPCSGSLSVAPNSCRLAQTCTDATYELTCQLTERGTYCECVSNGRPVFAGPGNGPPGDSACSDPALVARCGGG